MRGCLDFCNPGKSCNIFHVENECADLKQEADKAGDKHYRAMTEWVTKGRTRTLRDRALAFAVSYRRALHWLIDCYRRIRAGRSEKLETAVEFKALVDQDIKVLEESR